MTEVATLVGVIVLAVFGAAVLILLAYLLVDAFMCARFVWRLRKVTAEANNRIPDWHLVKSWFRYWIRLDSRPDYLTLISNNTTIYWPGKEGSRRYPG